MTLPVPVLTVVGALQTGGIQKLVLHLAENLDRSAWAPEVALMTDGDEGDLAPRFRALGVPLHRVSLRSAPWSFLARMADLLRERRIGVLHSIRTGTMNALPLLAGARAGVPIRIAHFQNEYSPASVPLSRRLAHPFLRALLRRHATHVIGISTQSLRTQLGPDWESLANVHRFPNAVDVEAFRSPQNPAATRASVGLAPEHFVVGNVSRFSAAKNQALIVEVAARLVPKHPRLRFLLVGDGATRQSVMERARALGVEDAIAFPGTRSDVPALLAACDAYLFPSFWEGSPLALLEALAAGLPCLASDIEPHREILPPLLQARLFSPHDAGAAAAALEALLADGGARAALAHAAREHADQFDIRHYIERLLPLYRGAA